MNAALMLMLAVGCEPHLTDEMLGEINAAKSVTYFFVCPYCGSCDINPRPGSKRWELWELFGGKVRLVPAQRSIRVECGKI